MIRLGFRRVWEGKKEQTKSILNESENGKEIKK